LTKQANAGDFDAFIETLQSRGHRKFNLENAYIPLEGDPRRYFPLLERLGHDDASSAIQKSMWGCLIRETNDELPPQQEPSHRAAVQRLLQFRARLQEKYSLDDTVRSYAGVPARHPYLEEFFKAGEFGDCRSERAYSLSALYGLAERGYLDLLKLAVKYGGNPKADFYPADDRPVDAARRNKHMAVVHYLEAT
jgi:hypothetical protein